MQKYCHLTELTEEISKFAKVSNEKMLIEIPNSFVEKIDKNKNDLLLRALVCKYDVQYYID